MKGQNWITAGLLLALASGDALAQEASAEIPQVSAVPSPHSETHRNKSEQSLQSSTYRNEATKDYQRQVLSDPRISDIARAKELTGDGGNTAIITQSGSSNKSSVTQKGKNNYARQEQNGKANDIYLNQQGDHNRSEEKQVGDYNHKVKIQNGDEEETILQNGASE
jgi:hypothetical protein